jgi:hypothetical protein
MGRLDIGNHSHLWAGYFGQAFDFSWLIHSQLYHRCLMAAVQLQQGEWYTHQVVEGSMILENLPRSAKDSRNHLFGSGLTVGASDRHQRDGIAAAPELSQVPESTESVRNTHYRDLEALKTNRFLLLQGHDHTSGTTAYGLLEKLVTVKLFPLQGYKQVTSIQGATVSGDFAEALLSTLHQKPTPGGLQDRIQSPFVLLISHFAFRISHFGEIGLWFLLLIEQ